MLCGVSWSLCCGSVSTVCVGWRMSVYASVVLAGDCWCIIFQWCWLEAVSECCVVLAGDCWCMFQWFGLETVSVSFSGFGWRLLVYVSVVWAGDCQCILQWCWLETVGVCFSGLGWRLSVCTSVVLAGDCQ